MRGESGRLSNLHRVAAVKATDEGREANRAQTAAIRATAEGREANRAHAAAVRATDGGREANRFQAERSRAAKNLLRNSGIMRSLVSIAVAYGSNQTIHHHENYVVTEAVGVKWRRTLSLPGAIARHYSSSSDN